MVKFGLFDPGSKAAMQEYEGDFLQVQNENVAVIANDEKGIQRVVAVIRLAERQSVKKI